MNTTPTTPQDSIARVAVVEDDPELRERILVPGLRLFGFDATGLDSAEALYRHVHVGAPDLVILDVGLPKEDGFTAARRLRALLGMRVGIVMLTGRVAGSDMVQGLGDGADLYLPKPFEIEVVAAALHSLLRRMQASGGSEASSPDDTGWRLESDGWCLIAPTGKRLALTGAERQVIRVLADARGEPVTREALIGALTNDVASFDPHRLEMLIHRLRKKSESQTGEALPLRSARSTGYALSR